MREITFISDINEYLRESRPYLSWITVAYILCFAPTYLLLTLSPFEPPEGYGWLLLGAARPSVLGLVINLALAITFTLVKRRERDPIHREGYKKINLQWLRGSFLAMLATGLFYNLLIRPPANNRVDATLIVAYVLVMSMPVLPFLLPTRRSRRNTMGA